MNRQKLMRVFFVLCMLSLLLTACSNEETVTDPGMKLSDDGTYYIVTYGAPFVNDQFVHVIPDTYEGKPVKEIAAYAFDGLEDVYKVVIPDSVTVINEYAFYGCKNLENVVFSANLAVIGRSAFKETNLTSVKLPASLTSIDALAFDKDLESITIEAGNPIYHSDGNCIIETATKTLVSGFDNSIIPEDGSVQRIGDGAFRWCNFFYIDLPECITDIGLDAFEYAKVTYNVKEGVQYLGTKNDPYAFIMGLDSNTDAPAEFEIATTVKAIAPGVLGNNAFTSLTVAEDHPKYHAAGNCIIETATSTLVAAASVNCTIPNDGSVKVIGPYAFSACDMSQIVIPEGVITIKERAFENSARLARAEFPSSLVEIKDFAFSGCAVLSEAELPDSVQYIGMKAFNGCKALAVTKLPAAIQEIGARAFQHCILDSAMEERIASYYPKAT